MESLTIGILAKRAGVGVETVRFYERRGLVRRPPRPATGYRAYTKEAVERIRFIRQAQTLGFALQEIAELLALRLKAGSDCAAVRARAAARLAGVEARIAKLKKVRAALETLVAACPGRGALTCCTILEALDTSASIPPRNPPTSATPRSRGAALMKSLEVKIDGMHCDGCASTIEALLSHEAGVVSASVSFSKGKATVFYDPQETDPARLAAAIEKAGYRAGGAHNAATS